MSFIINPDDKFYPDANESIWSYCTFLGKYTDSQGLNYDLGIHIQYYNNNGDEYGDPIVEIVDATVHSNEPGDYTSGKIDDPNSSREWKKEVYRRCLILNLIK